MKFSEVIGQASVKKRLIQSVKDNRVSHAQLFLGKTGYGSLALAIAYGQYICCTNKQADDSCGTCPSCIKYAKYIHPDQHFAVPINAQESKKIENTTHILPLWRECLLDNSYPSLEVWMDYLDAENKQLGIAVKESEEILRKLTLKAYEGEYKIMLIWLVEKMNAAASNKLLKVLEEPPEKTLFLLVCEDEEQLLRTIVSRTQLVKVNRIEEGDLVKALVDRAGFTPEDAKAYAILSEGNFQIAQDLYRANDGEDWNLELFQEWMRACLRFDHPKLNVLMARFADAKREKQKVFFQYCLHLVRECLVLNYGSPSLRHLTEKEGLFLQKFSPYIHKNNGPLFAKELNLAYTHIERNANPKIMFMDLSLKINDFFKIK